MEPSQRSTPSTGSRPIGRLPPRRVRSSGDQSEALANGGGVGCDSIKAASSSQSSGRIEGWMGAIRSWLCTRGKEVVVEVERLAG
jgi:hypothetical protein